MIDIQESWINFHFFQVSPQSIFKQEYLEGLRGTSRGILDLKLDTGIEILSKAFGGDKEPKCLGSLLVL